MNYLLKPKPRRDTAFRRATWVVVITLAILLFFWFLGTNVALRVLGPVATPFWKAESKITGFFAQIVETIKSKDALIKENQTLKSQLVDMSSLSAERDELLAENARIKGAFTNFSNGEIARVLTSPAESIYDVLLVELGGNSKVTVGDRVYASNDLVIGEVSQREGKIAKIKLFSTSGQETDARLVKGGTVLSLSGRGSGNFVAMVPRSLDVSVGDEVILPSFAPSLIGEVGSVQDARADSFKNVYVSFPTNIFSLSWVRIVHTDENQ